MAIVAGSRDDRDKAEEVSAALPFPVAHGVTREQADAIGAWWEEKRDFIQPSEFVFRRNGQIIQSSYSSGPLARTLPEDVLALLGFLIARERKQN